jgi:copper(I)-binding protein
VIRRHRHRLAAAPATAALLAAAVTGCSAAADDPAAPDLSVSGAYVPEPPTADVAGGFLVVTNAGDADDTLVGARTDAAASVEIHETVGNAMHQVESLPVPAGGELRLDRGGNHLMLMDLTRPLAEGDTVTLRLEFATSEPVTVEVPVEAATFTGEAAGEEE